MSDDVQAHKRRLRADLRRRRAQTEAAERSEQAHAVAHRLLDHPLVAPLAPGRVLVPTTFRDELPTEPIAATLVAAGWTLVRPRADAHHTHLDAIEWPLERPLVAGYAGIQEPPPDAGPMLPTEALDLVLVPALGFDERGGRIGSGLGFFDRFLAPVRHRDRPLRLGIGHPVQLVDAVASEPHDVPLHGLQVGARSIVCTPSNATGQR